MRAATAAAALAICALVVFTAIHFSERPGAVVQVTPKAPTQAPPEAANTRPIEEINQSTPRDEREKQANVAEQKRPVETAKGNGVVAGRKSRGQSGAPVVVARQSRVAPGKVKASQEARQQLAELVQTSVVEDDLPRLSDLIEDSSGSN